MSVLVLAIWDRKVVRKFSRPGTVANGVLIAEVPSWTRCNWAITLCQISRPWFYGPFFPFAAWATKCSQTWL